MGRNLPNTGSMAAYVIFQVRMVHYLQLSSVLELRPATTPSESTSSQSLQRKQCHVPKYVRCCLGSCLLWSFFLIWSYCSLTSLLLLILHHHLSSYLYLLVSGIYSQTVGQLLDCSSHFSLLHLMIGRIHCADCSGTVEDIHIVTYLPPPTSFLISVM